MAISIEELSELLIQGGIKDSAVRSNIIKEAKILEETKKEDKKDSTGPKQKNKFLICVRGDEKLKEVLQAGWVLKLPESSDNSTVANRIIGAARLQNEGSKAKKMKISTYRYFFMACKRKFSKQQDLQILNKEAVEVIVLETEDIKFN